MRAQNSFSLLLLSCLLLSAAGCPKPAEPTPGKTCASDTDCKAGEERCVGGRCLALRCGDHPCHAGEGCLDGQCRAADCVEVTCAATEGCAFGECLPLACAGVACAVGEVCVEGSCTFTGCAQKTCAADALCADGRCWGKACGDTPCGEGAACVEERCVAAACVGIACAEGEACAAGHCVPTACGATACAAGQSCVDGACADPTCAGLTCGAGTRCSGGACLSCPAHETACGDAIDDDCDGQADCADPDCDTLDCAAGKACKSGACADEPCGNGALDGAEECDDGDRSAGDGCSRACTVECGWACDEEPSACTPVDFFDLSDAIASAAGTAVLESLAVADDGVYVGGGGGRLFHVDRAACAVTDLSAKLAGFWGDATILSMAWDPDSKVLYLGGSKQGRFAVFHPAGWKGTDPKYPGADQAYDLSAKHTFTTAPWTVDALAFDATGKALYLAVNDTTADGPSHLVRYRPDADACDLGLNSCPAPNLAPPNACGVKVMVIDEPGRVLWAAGRGKSWTGIHKLALDAGSFQKSVSANLTANLPSGLGWDPAGKALYLAGEWGYSAGGDLIRWVPESGEQTNLTPKLEGLWGAPGSDQHRNDLWALQVDPLNHSIYVGGNGSRMARYRTADSSENPDSVVLIGLSSLSWGQETVRSLAHDPAGFVWIAGENGRLARKVAR